METESGEENVTMDEQIIAALHSLNGAEPTAPLLPAAVEPTMVLYVHCNSSNIVCLDAVERARQFSTSHGQLPTGGGSYGVSRLCLYVTHQICHHTVHRPLKILFQQAPMQDSFPVVQATSEFNSTVSAGPT